MFFPRYQSLSKLGNSETYGILDTGTIHAFPKLDGANGVIWSEDGIVYCGSRNQVLDQNNTNRGFYNYVMDPNNRFLEFFRNHPDLILYGEWMIPHTFKGYRDEIWNTFQIFDVMRRGIYDNDYLPYNKYVPILCDFYLSYIPRVFQLKCTDIDHMKSETEIIQIIKENYEVKDLRFYVKDKNSLGEGIVLKRYDFVNKFMRTTWAKIIFDEFKQTKYQPKESTNTSTDIEQQIVEKAITAALIQKEAHKVMTARGFTEFIPSLTPHVMGLVFNCLLTEELPTLVRKLKFPNVDFRLLKKLCDNKVRNELNL